MADKTRVIKDPAIEYLFMQLFHQLDLGSCSANSKAGNFNALYVAMTDTGNANTEFTVAHTLGRIPVGYIVTYIDKGGVIYDSGTAWTASNFYLKCSTANTKVTLLIW